MPNEIDIAWAAGFLEGEGYFAWHKHGTYKTKSGQVRIKYGQAHVGADQVNIEPLQRLQAMFGGRLLGPYKTTHQPRYRWCSYGKHAVSVMLDVYPQLSKRRQEQCRKVFQIWKGTPKQGGLRIAA